jgi:hypothetical protein
MRDHEIAISIDDTMRLTPNSILELRFEDANWTSAINVASTVVPELNGTLALYLTADAEVGAMVDRAFPLFNWNSQLPAEEAFDKIASQPGVMWDTAQLYVTGIVRLLGVAELKPGDASRDLNFDQLDLVQVLQANRYLTGEPATWGEGDWNGGPGGWWGSPPVGDGVFDQKDIVAALQGGSYSSSEEAALKSNGVREDEQTSIVYDARTGAVSIDAPAGREITSINIDSAAGIFTGEPALGLGGSFDNDADANIFRAIFGCSFGCIGHWRLGNVAQPGLSESFLLNDLTVVGSLAGGFDLGDVDLIYVPGPPPLTIATLGLLGLLFYRWRPQTIAVRYVVK